MKKTKKMSKFEKAFADLPGYIFIDPVRMKTIDDLIFACKIQLGLIEEGQDGTENDNPEAIR